MNDAADDIDNGILAEVPGTVVAAATRSLPDPTTSLQERLSVVMDADWLGRVRIHCLRMKMKHHRYSHWAWVAYQAEPEAAAERIRQSRVTSRHFDFRERDWTIDPARRCRLSR
jgi:hypothetical protein